MAYVPPHARKNRPGEGTRKSGRSLTCLAAEQAKVQHGSNEEGRRSTFRAKKGSNYVHIITESEDFSNFHSNLCRASTQGVKKYKVHAPKCSCKALSAIPGQNNLVVVPEFQEGIPAVFVCEGTDERMFRENASLCEKKIGRKILGDSPQKKMNLPVGNDAPPFEVTCSKCLLTSQPNGFVAITSQSRGKLQPTIERARNATHAKWLEDDIGGDHYHFTVALNVSTLQTLCRGTGGEKEQATFNILHSLADDVVLPKELIDAFSSDALSDQFPHGLGYDEWGDIIYSFEDWLDTKNPHCYQVCFNIGHHLSSLLHFATSGYAKLEEYIMVVGFVDSCTTFELDLPGGKRYLGESSLGVALRKTEQECSLKIDEEWMSNQVPEKYGGDLFRSEGEIDVLVPGGKQAGNAYFIMPPPPNNP